MGRAPEPEVAFSDDGPIGMQFGSFRIIRKLGGGGMGTVYLAEHAAIGSRVAVKVLHPHLAQHPSLVNRFRAEALAVNVIHHENIVSIFDFAVAPTGEHYLVMEHLEGAPLSDLAARAPLDAKVAIPILAQICDALGAAHGRGVVHRDLKPDNVFLTRRGGNEHFVKLLDFGIAKLADAHSEMGPQTSAGVIVGTPEYMSPEQYLGSGVDGRADLYSLGTIAYQLATAHLPFQAGSLAAMMLSHRELAPTPPQVLNPAISKRFSDVILKLLSKRPEDRYATAAELKAALLSAAAPEPVQAPSIPAPAPTPPPVVYEATVLGATGQALRKVQAQDLSRGGVFLSADCFTPALQSRVIVQLQVPGGVLELPGEVVRHVSAVQSAAWRMPPGVGIQFVALSAETRRKLDEVLSGRALAPKPEPKVDAVAETLMTEWTRRAAKDLYAMLGAPADADFDTLRSRGREAKSELEALKARALPPQVANQLDRALEKLTQAVHTLTQVQRRAEYDAGRSNYRGVARCIAAGLSVTELERARNRFVADHPGCESRARIYATTAEAYLSAGDREGAVRAYEQALSEDPLTLRYHQRYWSLRRQGSGAPSTTAPHR